MKYSVMVCCCNAYIDTATKAAKISRTQFVLQNKGKMSFSKATARRMLASYADYQLEVGGERIDQSLDHFVYRRASDLEKGDTIYTAYILMD